MSSRRTTPARTPARVIPGRSFLSRAVLSLGTLGVMLGAPALLAAPAMAAASSAAASTSTTSPGMVVYHY